MEREKTHLLRRLWRLCYSMKLAIALLLILAAACTLGGILPQGSVANYYLNAYGQTWGGLILALGLDRVFSCWWFLLSALLLCLNLCLCSILRFPQLLRRTREAFSLEQRLAEVGHVSVSANAGEDFFARMGFRHVTEVAHEGAVWRYAVRRRAGLWGSWLTHLGMLMIIVGFALGQMFSFEATVYGVPGQEKPFDNGRYLMEIQDFQVLLRADYTVEQYVSTLAVTDTHSGETETGVARVNAPMDAFGMRLYQNSTGWAADVEVHKDGKLVRTEILCGGESLREMDGALALVFTKFYPDLGFGPDGKPLTLTPEVKNPYALFSLYYNGELLDMNLSKFGSPITVDEYQFYFTNPRQYTLIQVGRDPTVAFVAAGAAILLLGLGLAFYLRTEELWSDGETVWGRSLRGQALFDQKLRAMAGLEEEEETQ